MALDPAEKQNLIFAFAQDYLGDVRAEIRDPIARMGKGKIQTERQMVLGDLDRLHTPGAEARKLLDKLRVLDFVEFCHTRTLDPSDSQAETDMHKHLKSAAQGRFLSNNQPMSWRIHEARLNMRKDQIARRNESFSIQIQ